MAEPSDSFRDFEHVGWQTESAAAEYHNYFSSLTTQAMESLLDAAGVRGGMRVLDVATGAGYAAAAAAERGATTVGVDFATTQLALARQRYPTVEFREGDADALPFLEGSFDAVVMNFGIPHFSDPDAVIREAFRVLRSGGRFAFTTWDNVQEAVGFGITYGAAQTHGNMDVDLPPGPNFFLFSDPEQCRRSLGEAGFQSPSVTKVPQTWRMRSADSLFEAISKGTVRAAALLRAQTPEALSAIRTAMREAVSAYDREGTIELPMPAVLAAAERP